jgi:DNA polymerase II
MLESGTALESVKGRVLTRRTVQFKGQFEGTLALQYIIATANGAVEVLVPGAEFLSFCHETDLKRLLGADPGTAAAIRAVPLRLKSFEGLEVCGLYARSGGAQRQLQRIARDRDVPLFEADLRPEQRYLIERFVALDVEFLGSYAEAVSLPAFPLPSSQQPSQGQSLPRFIASKARRTEPCRDISLRSISLDLECSMAGELYSVGLYAEDHRKVIMVGPAPGAAQPGAEYIDWVADERALILALIDWFAAYDPCLIIGWALVSFDLALLHRRASLHGIALRLGRGGALLEWKVENKYRPETLSLPGRVALDGIDWLKAAFYQFDSYSLENVARHLLGEGKAINDVDNRGKEISQLFAQDKLALAHYNLNDCRLVWDIFAHTKLWDLVLARAELTGLELGRVGASVAAFNHLYLPYLHRAGYVAPTMPAGPGLESPGGYVMDSVPGLYRNILVLDYKSLYPSIIRTFLIDPKGMVEGMQQSDEKADATVPGFLGARFSRHNPILPALIGELSTRREQAKAERNAPLSQAIKIIMNSLYGVLGSQGCVFHDARLASSITMRGHQIMKQTRSWIEEQGYKVIYGDTDSTFVWLGDTELDADTADAQGRQLVVDINSRWQEKLSREFGLESFLELEFERHYEQFFMPTLRGSQEGSKKRYVGAVRSAEGKLELVFKGMEQVRSDWSGLAKRVQQSLFERLFSHQDIRDYLSQVIDELLLGKCDAQLVFCKRLRRDIEDYTAKSAPHVKVARQLVEQSGERRFGRRGCLIEYVITTQGPQAVAQRSAPLDYQYYIEKQIRPVAEPVFAVLRQSLDDIASRQLPLI